MSKTNSLLKWLRQGDSKAGSGAPEDYCPNCWGRSEYGGAFFEAAKNHNVDINTNDEQLGWVQEYANKHLSGIELKAQKDQLICEKCKLTYKPSRK